MMKLRTNQFTLVNIINTNFKRNRKNNYSSIAHNGFFQTFLRTLKTRFDGAIKNDKMIDYTFCIMLINTAKFPEN